jgi:hypothetical protein
MKTYTENSRKIDLVKFQKDMGVVDPDSADAKLDALEAALDVNKVALGKVSDVDNTTELTEADMLEDGTLVVYNN